MTQQEYDLDKIKKIVFMIRDKAHDGQYCMEPESACIHVEALCDSLMSHLNTFKEINKSPTPGEGNMSSGKFTFYGI